MYKFSTVYKESESVEICILWEISMNMYPTLDKYQSNRSSSMCTLGEMNNYKSETSISISSDIYMSHLGDLNKYTSDTNISMCPMGDPYKNKSAISRRSECYKYKVRIRLNLL